MKEVTDIAVVSIRRDVDRVLGIHPAGSVQSQILAHVLAECVEAVTQTVAVVDKQLMIDNCAVVFLETAWLDVDFVPIDVSHRHRPAVAGDVASFFQHVLHANPDELGRVLFGDEVL